MLTSYYKVTSISRKIHTILRIIITNEGKNENTNLKIVNLKIDDDYF